MNHTEEIRSVAAYFARPDALFPMKSAQQVRTHVLRNARSRWAKDVPTEEVIALYDSSLLKSGSKGFLVTAHKLYCSENRVIIPLDEIRDVEYDQHSILVHTVYGPKRYPTKKLTRPIFLFLKILAVDRENASNGSDALHAPASTC